MDDKIIEREFNGETVRWHPDFEAIPHRVTHLRAAPDDSKNAAPAKPKKPPSQAKAAKAKTPPPLVEPSPALPVESDSL